MSEEIERKDIDKLLQSIDEMLKDVDERYDKTRANAYTVRLTDHYAIQLRDEFNKLNGEWDALTKVKNKILEIIERDKNE